MNADSPGVEALARALQTMTEEMPGSLASCDMENGEEAIVLTASALLDSMPHADRLAIAGITELDKAAKSLIRSAISDGYYEARNDGETMEYAAGDATRRVLEVLEGYGLRLAALSAGSATPAPEASREEGGA